MGKLDRFIKTEDLALDNPTAPVSADDFLHIMGYGGFHLRKARAALRDFGVTGLFDSL